ncbi:MAG: allantoate amidohydrolase [Bryobacteraceae bacterium]
MKEQARRAMHLCRELAACSEEPGKTTRTFLSPPMKDVHRILSARMGEAGMQISVDAAGNLHGLLPGARPEAPRLLIGSHLDTVPDAGAFDGVLGVVLGILLAETFQSRQQILSIEVIGFSEEEGVRFGTPFIGSRALVGSLDQTDLDIRDRQGCSLQEAIRAFGLEPSDLAQARLADVAIGYLEFHIEQGPVLESLDCPLGIVDAIVGQSRLELVFAGKANHAGTTPMNLRQDALAGAAEWILEVERTACTYDGLVATVGQIDIAPNATNAIPARVVASLDVRHADDDVRRDRAHQLVSAAQAVARRRGLSLTCRHQLDLPAMPTDETMSNRLERAVRTTEYPVHRMASGAGHDAMIMAPHVPSAMLFLRSPRGVSHSPEESVLVDDVEAALVVGLQFLRDLESRYA